MIIAADDKKVIYDFNEPYSNMLEKYRKLDKITDFISYL